MGSYRTFPPVRPPCTVKGEEENEGILLANLFQSSRSTFSCASFPSFFAFKEGIWDTQISALGVRQQYPKVFVHTYGGRKSLILSTFTVVFRPSIGFSSPPLQFVSYSGIRLTRHSWNTNAISQKRPKCPQMEGRGFRGLKSLWQMVFRLKWIRGVSVTKVPTSSLSFPNTEDAGCIRNSSQIHTYRDIVHTHLCRSRSYTLILPPL